MDNSFENLKEKLPNNPNQEEILNKMIDSLRWQMEMLDQQLEIIKETNKQEGDEYVQTEILKFQFEEDLKILV